MNAYKVRRVVAACTVAGSLLVAPSESQAIFHWFGGGCGSCGTTANRPYTAAYAPYVAAYPAAPACNTCSPCAQTCNYMPQTCYRTVYQQVPVTSYQPVASCDACGNSVTAMRPVITYQTQARLVPYTTYRPVYTAAPTCSTCAPVATGCPTGGCGTSYVSPVSTSAGCSSCNTPSLSTPTYSTPSPSYSPAPSTTLGTPGSTVPSLAPTPAPQATESTSPQPTFRDDGGVTDPESRLRPIPDTATPSEEPSNKKTNSTLTPRLLDSDRTTYRPLKRTANVIPVSAEEELEADGWRAARR